MIDRTAAEEELSRAINSMGPYTMNATDYFSGLENRSFTANIAGVAAPKPMGRGRGAVDVSHSRLEEIRLAARINRLEPQNYPLGHLPTTDEILAGDMGAEITAGLRSLGISSGDSALSSRTTIPTVVRENIRIDGNVPVILDGDMFHPRYRTEQDDEDEIVQPSRELKYNPQKPLAEQFPTILEFQDPIPDPDPLQASSESDLNVSTCTVSTSISTTSCNSSKSRTKQGKKKKWFKVPVDMVLGGTRTAEDNFSYGPPLSPNSNYRARSVYGANGIRNIK